MMTTALDARRSRVGDLLRLDRPRPRRVDAAAVLIPGHERADDYVRRLQERSNEFAAWDGRVMVAEADGVAVHRLLIVDRYGQIYAVHDEQRSTDLPDADALEEWFRFLATACPECGVLDDPVLSGPTP
jgi:hypothetical protein